MTAILVLRAREDALRTSEKLRSAGFTPVISSVLDIAATHAPVALGAYDAVLVSSAKGIESAGPGADPFKTLPLHAVGAKTAKAAEDAGWRPRIVAGAAEAILPLLIAHYPAPAHFLYLAGRDRQAALETGLTAAGHRITAVNVYEARAATSLSEEARSALQSGKVGAALHYSRRSADIFLQLATAAGLSGGLSAFPHIALSADVAKPLEALGLDVFLAEKPDEAHLLDMLRQHVN